MERYDDRLGKVLIEREKVRHDRYESGCQREVWLKFALQIQRILDVGSLDRGVERGDLADAQPAPLECGECLGLDASAMYGVPRQAFQGRCAAEGAG